jgi:hypothetical protein
MDHYIIKSGPFDESYEQLRATGWRLNWESTPTQGAAAKPKSKLKFTCPRCSQKVWGKPDTLVDCGHCTVRMVRNEEKGGSYDLTRMRRALRDRSVASETPVTAS